MRIARSTITAVLLAATAASPALARQNFDSIQIASTPIAEGIYMLQGAGGNIGLAVGEDAVFVVDDQYAPLTAKILTAIRAITPMPVKFVLNTHWHFDHTGGNENMARAGGLVVAHDNVRRRMSSEQFIEALNRREPASPPAALPVVTFTEGVTFHLNGDSVVVAHVPAGHTDGDAVVFFRRANVVHTGDLFVSAGLPFVDLSSGGSIDGVIAAADMVLARTDANTKIIPGHGPIADRDRLRAFRDMVFALRDRMRTEVAARRTLDEVLADSIAKPYARDFPGGHDRFVRLLYQELSRP